MAVVVELLLVAAIVQLRCLMQQLLVVAAAIVRLRCYQQLLRLGVEVEEAAAMCSLLRLMKFLDFFRITRIPKLE